MNAAADFLFNHDANQLGLRIRNGEVIHRSGRGPIAGATAHVETSGDIERRITATRLLLTGPFALALRKKKDHRALYLTIDGQGFQILVELRPKQERAARTWAVAFNNRAMAGAR
jgi:hypothetical protein